MLSFRSMPRLFRTLVLAIPLAVISTLALPIASAFLIPLDRRGGTVARDGDHLQPWVFRLEHATGSRLVWFEKGRVWSKPGVGPPGASSVAVAGWSFATGTRGDPRFKVVTPEELPLPPHFQQAINAPGLVWGLAQEQRGWPFAALSCLVSAPMSPSAPNIFAIDRGVLLPTNDAAYRESIASVRVLPLGPVWPGLIADVAAHGAMWWALLTLVFFAFGGTGKAVRRARGQCPNCGYDLQHDFAAGCPECGWNRPDPAPASAAPAVLQVPAENDRTTAQ